MLSGTKRETLCEYIITKELFMDKDNSALFLKEAKV